MTPEEVRALSNAELDRLVVVEVMGGSPWRLNHFTTDGNAMLALIERMGTRGYEMLIIPGDGVTFFRNRAAVSESQNPVLPRAVAEAAVLAVMEEERA